MVRTVAVVLLLQAAAWSLWFLPADVPAEVLAAGEAAVPDDIAVQETKTQSSPLQWRVVSTGQREGMGTLWEVNYTVNHFTGEEDTQVSAGSVGLEQLRIYAGVAFILIAAALIYGEVKRYLRKARQDRPVDF